MDKIEVKKFSCQGTLAHLDQDNKTLHKGIRIIMNLLKTLGTQGLLRELGCPFLESFDKRMGAQGIDLIENQQQQKAQLTELEILGLLENAQQSLLSLENQSILTRSIPKNFHLLSSFTLSLGRLVESNPNLCINIMIQLQEPVFTE